MHRRRTHAHANLARPGYGNRPVRERDPGMIGKQFAHLNSPHREKTLSYNIPIWFVLLIQQTKRSESMPRPDPLASDADALIDAVIDREGRRSEERRVGKECGRKCRSRWSRYH